MIDKVLNDRYKILKLIGRGGMAYVYKAIDLKLNREVAVKVLREEYVENEQFIAKFDRESQAAAGLQHPNIVSVYDVDVEEDIYYIIMEYVDGITLKQYLNKKGHLDYIEATQFMIEIAGAIQCAHEHKIIHRDIKPHNILLTRDLTPKVADFGIARAITSSTVTISNQAMGSVHYISPEQARGGFVDERSDLYSMGIMFYELLTGELPFDAESSVSIAIKHIQDPIVPPKSLNDEIPDSVNEVILKLTQKKPEDRYQNTQELIEDLDVILDDYEATLPNNLVQTAPLDSFGTDLFTIEDDSAPITGEITAPQKRSDLKGWIIAGVVALVVIIAAGLFAANAMLNRQVIVPNVTNMSLQEAKTAIENVGLVAEVERETYNESVPAGNVISQNPANGSNVKEGSTVKLIVSQGTESTSVPDVIGLSEESANEELTDAGFNVEIQREYNSDYDSGIVFSTDPSAGVKLALGQTIIIYVSRGLETVTVPNLIGLSQSAAESQLNNSGLNIGTITQQSSSSYSAGTVLSQSPMSGSNVERGTYVSFVVSSGSSTQNTPPTTETTPSTDNNSNSGQSGSNNSGNNSDNNTTPGMNNNSPNNQNQNNNSSGGSEQ